MKQSLRKRIHEGECVVGCFQKTPAHAIAEILGLAGLDFAVADMEHGPIGIADLDRMALGARSAGLPLLIRSTGVVASAIWPALDLGCSGVMAPHVRNGADAGALADAVRYGRGARGFSPSGRAGDYGTAVAVEYRQRMDADNVIMAQIEDASALDELDAIAGNPDIDVLFVGPADLSLSLGCEMESPELDMAIDKVIAAAKRAGRAAGIFLGTPARFARWKDAGMTVFVIGSDQSLLLTSGKGIAALKGA
ncbi:2-keto-3-deoxy-L-rhamnonate aldolase RhmA [Hoeflea marina]|uniref:2-keto-3-deoxy-L-rhamnonate aldolase RhmA n=1 Tax=Hoeflea marina TaxID=274592 RepID=A0A317PN19_9HYPH|nr:aldolase/citrate lyase family protein [Hoeflea marina]PWW01923.1 2-keto-3-deoxy-L-rhamnonate aldolase RhmA [Hoeflea marina]